MQLNAGKIISAWAVAASLFVAAGPAVSQSDAGFAKSIAEYPDLEFTSVYADPGQAGKPGNNLYKPEGSGPFPAVVLAHTCGGLQAHMGDRARELVAAGYVVLLLDSYGPRRHTAFCQPRGVRAPRVYKDAFDGLKHLATLKEVDAARIYLVGLSLGSFAASVAASPEIAKALGSERRFRASVGWYGSCAFNPKSGPTLQLLYPDTDRPVLMLLAGKDQETPIAPCFPLLDTLKAQGRPVSWHVYEQATHGWDKSNPARGYVYNQEVTADAMDRTIDFLRRN